jgi:hypothetical protein
MLDIFRLFVFVWRVAPPPGAARTKVKMDDYRGIYDIGLKRGFYRI